MPEIPVIVHNAHVARYRLERDAPRLCLSSKSCTLLAEVGYYESRGESDEGVLSVMQTVINRKEHPSSRWKDTIEGVIKNKCEFTYNCDGSLSRGLTESAQWNRMLRLAYLLKTGYITPKIEEATHYHTHTSRPGWRNIFSYLGSVGNHRFYKCYERC